MSTLHGPLVRLKLTVAHMTPFWRTNQISSLRVSFNAQDGGKSYGNLAHWLELNYSKKSGIDRNSTTSTGSNDNCHGNNNNNITIVILEVIKNQNENNASSDHNNNKNNTSNDNDNCDDNDNCANSSNKNTTALESTMTEVIALEKTNSP